MPFKKLAASLNALEQLADLVRVDTLTVAHIAHQHFPDIGTKTHAVCLVAKLLLIRRTLCKESDGITVEDVQEQMVQLTQLQYKDVGKKPESVHTSIVHSDTASALDRLVRDGQLARKPSGRIFRAS